MSGAVLIKTLLIDCNFDEANLSGCHVFGSSVWRVSLRGAIQNDLVISEGGEPEITVDGLEIAQFVYLILENARLREAIDTITSKVVLILGRFTPERKQTLDLLRNALRKRNYVPMMFDFEKPRTRSFAETVSLLAHMSRFVIADLTDPRSIPQELTAIIPRLLSVPVRPVLRAGASEWTMFTDLASYPQVLQPFHYSDDLTLMECIESDMIIPAEQRCPELRARDLQRWN